MYFCADYDFSLLHRGTWNTRAITGCTKQPLFCTLIAFSTKWTTQRGPISAELYSKKKFLSNLFSSAAEFRWIWFRISSYLDQEIENFSIRIKNHVTIHEITEKNNCTYRQVCDWVAWNTWWPAGENKVQRVRVERRKKLWLVCWIYWIKGSGPRPWIIDVAKREPKRNW